jgi:hypothetical protein
VEDIPHFCGIYNLFNIWENLVGVTQEDDGLDVVVTVTRDCGQAIALQYIQLGK